MKLVTMGWEHVAPFAVPPDIAGKLVGVSECFVEDDGEPLALVGFLDMGGRGEIFIAVTEAARRTPVRLSRTARRFLDGLADIQDQPGRDYVRHLTATVLPGDERAARWVEWLGFHRESEVALGTRYVRKTWRKQQQHP